MDAEDVVGSVISYYKQTTYEPSIGLVVHLGGQPAIDAGGPRRHVLSEAIMGFVLKIEAFEGNGDRLLPKYSP